MNPISVAMAVLAITAITLSNAQTQAVEGNGNNNNNNNNNDNITKACSTTQYTELCTKILKSSPKSNGADLYGLAEIVMEFAADNASTIYSTLNQLQNGSSESDSDDSFMDQYVTDCLESYQDAIDQFEDTITALDFKAYNDIKTWINAVTSDIKTCDSGFKGNPGQDSPIAEMSANLDQTCSIILSITQLLSDEKSNVSS